MAAAEIVVMGGGPAGLQAARFLSQRGYTVEVYEEHPSVGRPQHCTGLISKRGFTEYVEAPRDAVIGEVRGAVLWPPTGEGIRVERERPVAYVVDRVLLEEELLGLAEEAGARVHLGVRAELHGEAVEAGGRLLEPELVVDARGLPGPLPLSFPALQYDFEASAGEWDTVHLFFGNAYSDGFFAWAVPLGEGRVRLGVASRSGVKERLDRLAATDARGLFRLGRRLGVMGGLVYAGGPLYPFVSGRMARIGDRAGQTKPTTGGGVVYLSIAARMLADAYSSGGLARYEKMWRRRMGREVRVQLAIRRFLSRLDDRGYEKLFSAIKRAGGGEALSARGDMDFQSTALLSLGVRVFSRSPLLALALLGELFKGFISSP